MKFISVWGSFFDALNFQFVQNQNGSVPKEWIRNPFKVNMSPHLESKYHFIITKNHEISYHWLDAYNVLICALTIIIHWIWWETKEERGFVMF